MYVIATFLLPRLCGSHSSGSMTKMNENNGKEFSDLRNLNSRSIGEDRPR